MQFGPTMIQARDVYGGYHIFENRKIYMCVQLCDRSHGASGDETKERIRPMQTPQQPQVMEEDTLGINNTSRCAGLRLLPEAREAEGGNWAVRMCLRSSE